MNKVYSKSRLLVSGACSNTSCEWMDNDRYIFQTRSFKI